jgi:hypothetical protein
MKRSAKLTLICYILAVSSIIIVVTYHNYSIGPIVEFSIPISIIEEADELSITYHSDSKTTTFYNYYVNKETNLNVTDLNNNCILQGESRVNTKITLNIEYFKYEANNLTSGLNTVIKPDLTLIDTLTFTFTVQELNNHIIGYIHPYDILLYINGCAIVIGIILFLTQNHTNTNEKEMRKVD